MESQTGELQLPEGVALDGSRSLAGLALGEVWRYLPAWMYFGYACLLLNTELTNLAPARGDLAWTIVFPLSVFLVFTTLRSTRAPDVTRRATMFFVTVGLALGLPALNLAWHRPSPLSLEDMRLWYELSNFFWAALMVAHAFGRQKTLVPLFFGVAFFYGLLLENGGIVLGFFHETNLPLTMIPPLVAPFATMVGWSLVIYMAAFVTWTLRGYLPWLQRNALLSALTMASVATLLDLQIDPLATATGCWVWDSTLPAWFEGVPLVNFIAWMCAVFPFGYLLFRAQQHWGIRDFGAWKLGHQLSMLAAVPATLLLAGACFMGTTLLVEGMNGPSWTLLNQFVARVLQ